DLTHQGSGIVATSQSGLESVAAIVQEILALQSRRCLAHDQLSRAFRRYLSSATDTGAGADSGAIVSTSANGHNGSPADTGAGADSGAIVSTSANGHNGSPADTGAGADSGAIVSTSANGHNGSPAAANAETVYLTAIQECTTQFGSISNDFLELMRRLRQLDSDSAVSQRPAELLLRHAEKLQDLEAQRLRVTVDWQHAACRCTDDSDEHQLRLHLRQLADELDEVVEAVKLDFDD
ncbi:hypothetical protein BOX15_Mlig024723g1, partial [Macrostomum lignano]